MGVILFIPMSVSANEQKENFDLQGSAHISSECKVKTILETKALEEVEERTLTEAARVGTKVENYKKAQVRGYAPVYGKYDAMYPQGTSKTKSVTVSIAASTKVDGWPLEAVVGTSSSITVNGPEYNTKMPGRDINATHAALIGVMYGTIVHEEFDYVEATTNALISHVNRNTVGGAHVNAYALLVSEGVNQFLVGHSSKNISSEFIKFDYWRSLLESQDVVKAFAW